MVLSPDGRWIVYSESSTATYIARSDGSEKRILSSGADLSDPVFSPDGSCIAFVHNLGAIARLIVVDVQSGTVTHISDSVRTERRAYPTHDRDGEVTWSPDGTHLAFTRLHSDTVSRVWSVDRYGNGLRALTPLGAIDWSPRWSSDGSRIAFATGKFHHWPTRVDIAIMSADGTDRQIVASTTEGYQVCGFPEWSQDSRRLLYMTLSSALYYTPQPKLMIADLASRTSVVKAIGVGRSYWDLSTR